MRPTSVAWSQHCLWPSPPSWPVWALTLRAPAVLYEHQSRKQHFFNGNTEMGQSSYKWIWTSWTDLDQGSYTVLTMTGYLGLKVSHGLIEGLRRSPLVVTQDGHGSVSPVVREQLLGAAVWLFGNWQEKCGIYIYLIKKKKSHLCTFTKTVKDKTSRCPHFYS